MAVLVTAIHVFFFGIARRGWPGLGLRPARPWRRWVVACGDKTLFSRRKTSTGQPRACLGNLWTRGTSPRV